MRDDVKEALESWDAGRPVSTVEMSGIGPGYEQAIQILVFELLRADEPWTDGATLGEWGNGVVARADKLLQFSGAQVAVAKNLASRVMAVGWEATLSEAGIDRRILVSTAFPDAAEVRAAASQTEGRPMEDENG